MKLNLYLLFYFFTSFTQAQIITTIAGTGVAGFSGDGGPALSAQLNEPCGIAVDSSGNVYVSTIFDGRIRKIDAATGIISTIAGTGFKTFNGDNIPAISANLFDPFGMVFDSYGNLLVAVGGNCMVRKINLTNGLISTLAGTTYCFYNGDNIPANTARLNPADIAIDSNDNIYVADFVNGRVRMIENKTGLISTIAGIEVSGYNGDGIPATYAALCAPETIALDRQGNVYFSDDGCLRLRKIDRTTGIISTVAGNGQWGPSGNGGNPANATIKSVFGLTVDAFGNIYTAESDTNVIRKIDINTNTIDVIAGLGTGASGDGGPAMLATFNRPSGITLDRFGNMYIAELGNHRIRKISGLFSNTSETKVSTGQTQIFPNPFHSKISVVIPDKPHRRLMFNVKDMSGKAILQTEASVATNTLTKEVNLDFLDSGIYFVETLIDDTKYFNKIIKY